MKKILLLILSLILLTGCKTQSVESNETAALKILAPSGAPALALVELFSLPEKYSIHVVDGSDVLQAAFVQPDSEYDVIIAPTNLGVKLIQSGKTEYQLAGVVTWGNLYVLAENEDVLKNENTVFAGFGQQAVPGLVFESIKDHLGIHEINYFNSVTEAQAALLSGNADAALIAEPAATAAIAKANEKGMNLKIVADVQDLWHLETGSLGYPQASVFVKATEKNRQQIHSLIEHISNTIDKYHKYAQESQYDLIASGIDSAQAETLGVPNSAVCAKSYSRLGLDYRPASECEKELQDFLRLFNIEYAQDSVLWQE